jgi:hypothetical protein
MPRSTNKPIKKKEVKVVVDEETTNMLKYLGNLNQMV